MFILQSYMEGVELMIQVKKNQIEFFALSRE